MNKVIPAIAQESTLYLLDHIHESPQITQRKLSKKLDISLGKINFIIKELSMKGWLKAKRATHSDNKLAYVYLLTPKGVKQKAELTKEFLKRKIEEYNQLEGEIELLKEKIAKD